METGLYLVERYLPSGSCHDAAADARRVQAATEQLAANGIAIRYLGATFVPVDDTCFFEFEAPTLEAVALAHDRADLTFARILAAVRLWDHENGRSAP